MHFSSMGVRVGVECIDGTNTFQLNLLSSMKIVGVTSSSMQIVGVTGLCGLWALTSMKIVGATGLT